MIFAVVVPMLPERRLRDREQLARRPTSTHADRPELATDLATEPGEIQYAG
ncbi:hypothetical protein ACFV4K_04490 [Nocardia sp. NPDC059764]|uniref:hypothetical protein n=1 Tax=Nocardia sp. NPDC059764 TaxID=3346939 RepID=UPI00365B1822